MKQLSANSLKELIDRLQSIYEREGDMPVYYLHDEFDLVYTPVLIEIVDDAQYEVDKVAPRGLQFSC